MAVLNFASYSLDYKVIAQGYEDGKGDWIQGEKSWIKDYCKCDVVPAGRADVISLPDGTVQHYSYTIYNLPNTCRDFAYGDIIRIKPDGGNAREFKVLGFHRYQLQCKIWI